MKHRSIALALTLAVVLASAGGCFAADAAAPPQATSAAQANSKGTSPGKSETAVKAKAPASTKLVDINTANSKQLKKLPGVSDAEAAKIIAGRPYSSKAQLVARNIIDGAVYENLKQLIVAKQPYKDGAKNAAIYAKPK